jgi:hypothetical protein
MKEVLDHWKEGLGVLTYFGFLAYFTPKAEAAGWGYRGLLFCVMVGALLVFLLYIMVKYIAEYISDHREEVSSFREYMGIGTHPEQVSLAAIGTVDDHTADEIDAMLATNPYASAEVIDNDKYTRLLPTVSADDDYLSPRQGSCLTDEASGEEEDLGQAAIIGENPRRRLLLADNFQPDANDPLATGVFVVGIPGSGKTVTLALFLEQYIKRFHLPAVVFDIVGDLKSIVDDGRICPRGLVATPDALPRMAQVVRYRMQVIVDLQQCRRPGEAFLNYELAGRLIAQTLKDLMNAQSAIDPDLRLPCLIGLDETHIWAPQNPPSYLSPMTAKDLLDTLTVVATTGRKYGVVPLFAAQRIPKVHKDIIAGCETRLLGKADLDNDIKRYREYVSPEVISDRGIRQLSRGRMVVCMNGKQLIVQFYQRESRHISHTPGVTQALDQLAGKIPPELLASISRPLETVPPASLTQSPGLRPVTRTTTSPTGGFTTAIPAELRRARELYWPGMSHRDLARAMGIDSRTAIELMRQLKTRRLIGGRQSGQAPLVRENSTATPQPPELATITVLPVRSEQKPHPTLKDAIACWNELVEAGQNPSRNNLQQALLSKGFDCKENWARKFYEDIKDMLKEQPKASVGG